jgi:hypothetical protein
MMAITTRSSTSVKPRRREVRDGFMLDSKKRTHLRQIDAHDFVDGTEAAREGEEMRKRGGFRARSMEVACNALATESAVPVCFP